jgi:hypothetical protein
MSKYLCIYYDSGHTSRRVVVSKKTTADQRNRHITAQTTQSGKAWAAGEKCLMPEA